jgi:hypothetical protein
MPRVTGSIPTPLPPLPPGVPNAAVEVPKAAAVVPKAASALPPSSDYSSEVGMPLPFLLPFPAMHHCSGRRSGGGEEPHVPDGSLCASARACSAFFVLFSHFH